MFKNRKAQSTLEYAMVAVCLAGALIAMQIYVKRSIQGRIRGAADEVGEQYSAKKTTSVINQGFTSTTAIEGSPLIVPDLYDPVTGQKESREFIVNKRTEFQTSTQKAGSHETTGEFEKELFD